MKLSKSKSSNASKLMQVMIRKIVSNFALIMLSHIYIKPQYILRTTLTGKPFCNIHLMNFSDPICLPIRSQCTLFLPPENIRTVFWCFQVVEKGYIGNKWVNHYMNIYTRIPWHSSGLAKSRVFVRDLQFMTSYLES